jgi:tetratricopeptide (TPR) repeat protein
MAFQKAKALQEAQKYVTQGKNALAIRQYLSILENDPSDLILLNTVGDLYVRDKNLPEGLKLFYKLADAYIQEGFVVKAIAIYRKIAKIDRDTAEPWLKLGELYLTQGHVREACEQCTNAFEFYRKTNQHGKALEVLHKLTRMDLDNPRHHLQLAQYAERSGEAKQAADAYLETARVAQRQGDALTAESALRRAVELAPNSPELELFRARQAFDEQRLEKVEKTLAAVPDLQNDPRAQQLLLETYLAAHNLDAASKLLLKVFRANPSDFTPVANYAAQCLAQQDYGRAHEAASSVAPDLIKQKKTAPLLEVLRKIWEAAPERIDNLELIYDVCEKTADEFAIPEVLEALGTAYVQAGELAKAEQTYARLAAREPLNESYRDLLKQVLRQQGKECAAPDLSALAGAELPLDAASAPSASSEIEVGLPSAAAPEQAFSPQEIGLEQSAAVRPASAEEESTPKRLRMPSAPETPAEVPPFNSQESREEIEFYTAHGFHAEAQRAVRNLEERYPGEPEVAALRRLVDQAEQQGEAESPETLEEGYLPSFESAAPAGPREVVVDLGAELALSLRDLRAPEPPTLPSDLVSDLNPGPQSADATSAELSTLLEELREGEAAEKSQDDPQTHYNLGVAFHEMGLHDEAIGEFQKVVKGALPSQLPPNFLQACTLLASCFMEKGMPAIAAQWCSRALEIPGLDQDAGLALRYDLGAALEQAGDHKSALQNFTEVYSQNIDYRDVAEKIRILRGKAS